MILIVKTGETRERERERAVHQGDDEATCLYVTRGQGVISLNLKSDCIPDALGLWRYDIHDSSEVIAEFLH